MHRERITQLGDFHKSAAWQRLRRRCKDHCRRIDAKCHECIRRGDIEHAGIDYTSVRSTWSFEADHLLSVDAYPHLALEWGNLRPAHARCNRRKHTKGIEQQQVWFKPDR
jgi:5-methylcytosine-specific restriction endonuclease McrA